ncbi:MAG: CARDB domain-containing protein [Candidatus Bathyarchaeia archaeon]
MIEVKRRAFVIVKFFVVTVFLFLVSGCTIFSPSSTDQHLNVELNESVTDSNGKAEFFSETVRSNVVIYTNNEHGSPISNLRVAYVASAQHCAIFVNDASNTYLPGIYFGPISDLLSPKLAVEAGLETGGALLGVGLVASAGVVHFILSQTTAQGLIQVAPVFSELLSALSSFLSSVARVIGKQNTGTFGSLIDITFGTFGLKQGIMEIILSPQKRYYYIIKPTSYEYIVNEFKDDLKNELLEKGYQFMMCDEIEIITFPIVDFVIIKIKNQCPRITLKTTPLDGEAPLTVTFDASESFDPDGRVTAFEWEFGDGNRGTGPLISHTYKIPNTYTVTLKVKDDKGAVNQQSVVINVRPPKCPDLVTDGIRLDPAQFAVGQRVSVVFKVRNTGTTSAPAFRVSIMMDDKPLESLTLNKLDPRQEIEVRSSPFIWPDASCHLLGVVLDPDNSVNECDEQNNRTSTQFCPSQQCANRPSIWTDKYEYCVGDQVNIFIRVSVPSHVDLWVVNPYGQVKYLLENYYFDDPGKQYVIKAKASEPPGQRALYLRTRACGNEVTVSCTLSVKYCSDSPIALPDLIVESVEIFRIDLSKCPYHLGVNLTITVANVGRSSADPFEVSVCLTSCPAVCCIPCQTRTIGPLGVGERKTFTVIFDIPVMCFLWGADPPMNPPVAEIRVTADSTERIIEQQENNNQKIIDVPYICPTS